MKIRVPLFERWEPHELGSSLPIAGRLKRWALGLFLVWVAAALGVGWAIWNLGQPGTDPAGDAYVRQVVWDRLARTELPVWSPGGELPEVPAPAFAPPPPPPPTLVPHPGDPPLREERRLREALARLQGDDVLGATTDLVEMADRQPTSWLLAYDRALGYLAAGFHDRAMGAVEDAEARLDVYAPRYGNDPRHQAAVVATRYAAAHAGRQADCVQAIHDLKIAISGLRRFVQTGGARTFDRRLPYGVDPHPLSNLDVWSALVETYLQCEDGYPSKYFRRYSDALSFRQAEYGDANAVEVQEGPFPVELAGCIESDGATARCWAVSNLNALYQANRSLLKRDDLPSSFDPHRNALARLAYNTALLAATGPDADNAPEILLQAQRLRPQDGELQEKIDDLARHLGAKYENFGVLAEGYRGRSVENLDLGPETSPEDLKGMAWALREQWQRHLQQGNPAEVFAEADRARQYLPDEHLDSLEDWEGEAHEALRDALADEIRVQKRRGNLAMAAGLRDFRADWLGEGWEEEADDAWWTWELRAVQWGLGALLLVLLVILVYVYRYAVYPYVMYTTDFYRAEFERRERERKAANLPVTGQEMYEMEQRRRGEMP